MNQTINQKQIKNEIERLYSHAGSDIDRSAIIRKDYIILCTAIMEGFKCKQTVGKFKVSCEKNSNEFFKIF